MNKSKFLWKRMDALYIEWKQLERLVDKRLSDLLKRPVHPRIVWDLDYWEVLTDVLTPEEMEKLLILGNADKEDHQAHAPYESGRIKDLTDVFTIKLLQPEFIFPVEKSEVTEHGLYLLSKGQSFTKEYGSKEVSYESV